MFCAVVKICGPVKNYRLETIIRLFHGQTFMICLYNCSSLLAISDSRAHSFVEALELQAAPTMAWARDFTLSCFSCGSRADMTSFPLRCFFSYKRNKETHPSARGAIPPPATTSASRLAAHMFFPGNWSYNLGYYSRTGGGNRNYFNYSVQSFNRRHFRH